MAVKDFIAAREAKKKPLVVVEKPIVYAPPRNGRDGVDGTNGLHGKDGGKGDRGDKGDKGDKGDAGTPADNKLIESLQKQIALLVAEEPATEKKRNWTFTIVRDHAGFAKEIKARED
jgi:hypothetical protein